MRITPYWYSLFLSKGNEAFASFDWSKVIIILYTYSSYAVSPVTRALPCTSENWNVPAVMSQTSHTCLWIPLFHLLSSFHADLAGQPSEMAPTHHCCLWERTLWKTLLWELKAGPMKCKYVDNLMKFCFKRYCKTLAAHKVLWNWC